MALSPEEADLVWALFGDSPLWIRWPEYRVDVAARLSAVHLRAGEVVFEPGSGGDYLYLTGKGAVAETFAAEGKTWFQQEWRPGDLFGQQALFNGQCQTKAAAATDAIVFRMPAGDLRLALEKNPELRGWLLHEQRASRLRSIPLFEPLTDADIRLLAHLVVEETVAAGERLPLHQKPGLWIIDWGQVQVAGPASFGRPDWRLTAGNFFLTPNVVPGSRCLATEVVAAQRSSLFHLPDTHLHRLLHGFPTIHKRMGRPLDLMAILQQVPPIAASAGITGEHLGHLAQYCARKYVPAGQNITTQGIVGYSFIILYQGAATVSSVDERGRMRPRNLLRAPHFFGMTSLRESRPRDATVRAARTAPSESHPGRPVLAGAELVILDRRDLLYAFAERPDLWRQGIELYDQTAAQEEDCPYEWMEEGEVVIWRGRPHLLWLLGPLAGVIMLVLLALGLMLPVSQAVQPALALALLVVLGLFLIPLGLWVIVNYFDDYYAVTNRRVTRRDRELLMHDARIDAPVEMIQDVTVDTTFLGRLFGYGDVTARTAAKVGAISFSHVPQPDVVKGYIVRELVGAAGGGRGPTKQNFRKRFIIGF